MVGAAEYGPERVACAGGPAHALEMVEAGAGLVCASRSEALAHRVADCFQRAGVVCEVSDDPTGVELAGVAKNAAAVAVGASQAQGLNAAGMAAADIFLEVLALAARSGGRAQTFVGRAGTGDLVATALAPTSGWPRCVRSSPRPQPSAARGHGGAGLESGSRAARIESRMKPDIHPEYGPSHVRCTCGNEFWTRSTKPELHVEICSNCHPFYTGRQKLVDTGGRVERFRRRAARSRR